MTDEVIASGSAASNFEQERGNVLSEPLLRIRNHHAVGSGDPPIVVGDDADTYIGYFENAYSEQWIFTYDRKTGEAFLRGGDIGWNTLQKVEGGSVGDLKLTKNEALWLQACWRAAVPSAR